MTNTSAALRTPANGLATTGDEPVVRSSILVLLVEDNEPNQYAMARVLRSAGYEVICANRGRQALDLARAHNPQLVILDIGLPDMLGWDVCRELKHGETTSTIPVLQVSASYTTEQDHVRSLDDGADTYLVHPIEPTVLLATVKALLRLRTAYDALRRSDERLLTVLNNAPLILFAVNRDEVYTLFTGNGVGRLDLSPESIVGQSIRTLHANDARFLKNAAAALQGHTFVDDLPFHGRWFEVRYNPLRGSLAALDGFVAVATDITDRRNAERAREEMLAIVAHDLRNPIDTIQINVGVLRRALERYLPAGVPAQAEEMLARMARSVQRAERLITDLLDGAKMEAGTFTVTASEQNMMPLLLETIDVMMPIARAKEVQLIHEISEDLEACFDATRLSQALCNLLDNAIKFSPSQTTITLRLISEMREVVIAIEDTGRGIPEADFPHLFNRFWQGTTNREHGAGLGLSIAAGIVRAHGGRIWAENRPSKGATFYVALPKERAVRP